MAKPSRFALVIAAESLVIAPAILVVSFLSLIPPLRAHDQAFQFVANFHPWSIVIGILAAVVVWGIGGRLWFRILMEEQGEPIPDENGG